jgi:hypothetical protein
VMGVSRGIVRFWLLTGALSLLAAAAAAGGLWLRPRPAATWVLAGLVLVEAACFAAPYNPQLSGADVRPRSQVVDWLREHADGARVTGVGPALFPNVSGLYGLSDVRSYDALESPRTRDYWARADPGLDNPRGYIFLNRPDAAWLAAAGVRYVVSPGDAALPGTREVLRAEGVVVGEVPEARPLVFLASEAVAVGDEPAALDLLARDVSGPVVVEAAVPPGTGGGTVAITARTEGRVLAEVEADAPATLVFLTAAWPGWQARLDGRPVAIAPADVMFQSVQVPAGRHRVELAFEPATVPVGTGLTVLGLVLASGLVFAGWRRR